MKGLQLIATGGALPGRTVTNEDLSRMVDTSDEWITSRTGIRTRHWCTDEESAATLAVRAAKQALERSGLAPADIACCICATLSAPDATPSVACQVQAALGLPIDVQAQHIDMLSLSGHKFHGPKGVGALYVRGGIPLVNVIEGGAQERGKRAGTENVPGIAGMAAALEEACAHMEENRVKVTALRDKLIAGLSRIPHSAVNGDLEHRLPGNVNFCFEGIEGESLLLLLDAAGICASSGSACTSGSLDPSHVLLAIGRPHEVAHGSLRLSLCEWNTEEEVDHILREVPRVVEYLRSMSPVWKDLESGKKAFML